MRELCVFIQGYVQNTYFVADTIQGAGHLMVNKKDMACPHIAYCYTYKLIFESANCYKGAEIQESAGLDFRKYQEGKSSLKREINTKVGRKLPVERKEIRKVLRGPTPQCV